ncbi:MAG: hypothetical protein COB51_08650 [Moraxellaceae bacterium]|nr:MAG: hypothetical protein COB51_08650 [Moraxellaceae bacterium]
MKSRAWFISEYKFISHALGRILLVFGLSGIVLANDTENNHTPKNGALALTVDEPFLINPFVNPETYASVLKDYRTQFYRVTGFEFSGLHWNLFVAIYVSKDADIYRQNYFEYVRAYLENDEDEDEVEPNFGTFSVGTVFLKENFSSSEGKPGVPVFLTGMIKREPGYDPEGRDWEYFQSDKDGAIILQGSSKNPEVQSMCIECHSNMDDRDYIFSTYYSERASYD